MCSRPSVQSLFSWALDCLCKSVEVTVCLSDGISQVFQSSRITLTILYLGFNRLLLVTPIARETIESVMRIDDSRVNDE